MRNELAVLKLTTHRYRALYIALPVYAVLLVGIAHLHLAIVTIPVVSTLALVYMMLVILTLGAFANPESDLAGDAPALPTYLLRLPVPTRALALPPLLGAALWPAAAWLVLVAGFMRPYGIPAPLAWPAAMLGALGPTLMAVQWAPFRSGKLRFTLGLVAPLAIIITGLWLSVDPANAPRLTIGFALLSLASGAAAWMGLAKSRISNAGPIPKERSVSRSRPAKAARPMPPFSSAMAAQRWLEWRRQGRNLPLVTGLALTALSLPLLWERDLQTAYFPDGLVMNVYVQTAFTFLLWVPVLFGTVIGLGARRSDARGADGVYHPFFATRPLDGAGLVRAKAQVGILSVLATAGVCLAFTLLWVLIPAQAGARRGPLLLLAIPVLETQFVVNVLVFALLIGFLTWRNQALGAFVDFLPARHGKRIYATAIILTGFFAFSMFSIYSREISNPLNIGRITTGLAFLAVLKLAAVFVISHSTVHLRPTAWKEIRTSLAVWAGGATLVIATLLKLSAFGGDNLAPLFRHFPAIALAGILITPLARLLASRWALESGRHG